MITEISSGNGYIGRGAFVEYNASWDLSCNPQIRQMRASLALLYAQDPDLGNVGSLLLQLDRLLAITRTWRHFMDQQTPFKTPSIPWCLRYALMESAEIMDAWAKTTRTDPRNRPLDSPIQHEYADTLIMTLTALCQPGATLPDQPPWSFSSWDETAQQIQVAQHNLGQIVGAGGTAYDLICIEAANALRAHFTREAFWQNYAIQIVYLCAAQLNCETFIEFANVLDKWEKRWHPEQRIA